MISIVIIILIQVILALAYFLNKYYHISKDIANFKPIQLWIGEQRTYTSNDEKFLITKKSVLEIYRKKIDLNIASLPDMMRDPKVSNDDLRRYQGKFQALLEIQSDLTYLINKEVVKEK